MTLAALAIDMQARPVTLHRHDAGAFIGGVYQTGPETSTTIMAVVQAPGEKDLRLVPEGERVEAYVIIFTRTELHPSDEGSGAPADVIETARGQRFKVVTCALRDEGGFVRALGRLVNDRGRSL